LKNSVGLEAGPLLLSSIHNQLGGHVRLLINVGGPVADETRRILTGLGLPMADCYGLAETGPLTVARGGEHTQRKPGGSAIPTIELKVDAPDAEGLGEVLARGPTIPRSAQDGAAGWTRTGDLGILDARGRLSLVSRRVHAVRTEDGTWVHSRTLAECLKSIEDIAEIALLADAADPAGATLFVVPGKLIAPAELENWRRRITSAIEARLTNLTPSFRPGRIRVHNAALPRTPDGDLDCPALLETLTAKTSADPVTSYSSIPSGSVNGAHRPDRSQLKPLWALAQRLTRRRSGQAAQS
jgi:long-chain acyl-CoA synthetase